jgi:hypothetical protein
VIELLDAAFTIDCCFRGDEYWTLFAEGTPGLLFVVDHMPVPGLPIHAGRAFEAPPDADRSARSGRVGRLGHRLRP